MGVVHECACWTGRVWVAADGAARARKAGPWAACRSNAVVGRPSKSGAAAGSAGRARNPPTRPPACRLYMHSLLASAATAAALLSPADHSGPGAEGPAAAADRIPGGCPAAATGACRAARRRLGRLPEHVREFPSTRTEPDELAGCCERGQRSVLAAHLDATHLLRIQCVFCLRPSVVLFLEIHLLHMCAPQAVARQGNGGTAREGGRVQPCKGVGAAARPSPGRGTPRRAAPSLCPVNAIAPGRLPDGGSCCSADLLLRLLSRPLGGGSPRPGRSPSRCTPTLCNRVSVCLSAPRVLRGHLPRRVAAAGRNGSSMDPAALLRAGSWQVSAARRRRGRSEAAAGHAGTREGPQPPMLPLPRSRRTSSC